ncbi:MAG: MBL fold metallo-hydrolase [Dehalococcoidales bacterium]|nr:MBL fold metallo-hydrolase [Dehalococcoidales bacterium]
MIIKRLVVGGWRANCYIVGSEATKQGLIIDPGDEENSILKAVKELGLDIKVLVATHGHIDHIGAIGELKHAIGASVAIHRSDSTALQGDGRFFWGQYFGPPMHADRLLQEGDAVSVSDINFTVINTPGHTYGGICLYGHGMVFTGDTLFHNSIGSSGIGTGTRSELLDSIINKIMVLPPETVIYPGHGSPTTVEAERKNNPYIRLDRYYR